jgi:hypothetical protein
VDLSREIVATLAHLAPLFTDGVRLRDQNLAVGALLATGNRSVYSALPDSGLGQEERFNYYHCVLNRDVWSCPVARWHSPSLHVSLTRALARDR